MWTGISSTSDWKQIEMFRQNVSYEIQTTSQSTKQPKFEQRMNVKIFQFMQYMNFFTPSAQLEKKSWKFYMFLLVSQPQTHCTFCTFLIWKLSIVKTTQKLQFPFFNLSAIITSNYILLPINKNSNNSFKVLYSLEILLQHI